MQRGRRSLLRRSALAAAAASLAFGACGPALVPPAAAEGFETFDSCDALLERLHRTGVEHVGPFGWDTSATAYDYGMAEDRAMPDAVPAPAAEAPTSAGAQEGATDSAAGDVTVSGTNVQEAGVDEADTVKTAPGRILVLDGATLHYVDVTGEAPVVRGTIEVPGATELLVKGDRVLVIGTATGSTSPGSTSPGSTSPGKGGNGGIVYEEPPAYAAGTRLTEIDVSDPDRPVSVRSLQAEGSLVAARLHDGTARLVVEYQPEFDFVAPSAGSRAMDRAIQANRDVVESSSIDDWLPHLTGADGARRTVDCNGVMVPKSYAGMGMLSVLTVDLDSPIEFGGDASVVSHGSEVYASESTLYVSTTEPQVTGTRSGVVAPRTANSTAVHAFDVTGREPARYIASGSVSGSLYDQWAMSEQAGVLRVASTNRTSAGRSVSSVTALRLDGDRLVEVGRVEGLGPNEEIKAVRMAGDRGYVVTFRKTDPLFVLDLADPARPKVAGELKVPGFSEYLHPLPDGRLLGVGQDADESTGRTRGLQVSLFDVSDPTAPKRLDTWKAPAGSHSPVETDHKAFLYWAPTGNVVLPVENYGGGGTVEPMPVPTTVPETVTDSAGSAGSAVAPAPRSGFTVLGVDSSTVRQAANLPGPAAAPYYGTSAARSVVSGDVLYTISGNGIAAYRLGDFAALGTADL